MFDVLFTGDTFLVNKSKLGGKSFTTSVEDLFSKSRYTCINLETTVGKGGLKVPKAYNFQAPPDAIENLVNNGITICNLANNHSLDYGIEGLENTKKLLYSNNISYIGTEGCNEKILEINGNKVCISAYYGNQKGLASISRQRIIDDINRLKENVDILFICLHWGEEYVAYPKPEQQQLAHDLIEAGANAVIGHHPHVVQGYEEYNDGYIFYSLGNFNFFVDHPYAKTLPETTIAYCVGFCVNKNRQISYNIVPIHINKEWQPEVISNEKNIDRFTSYLKAISEPLKSGIKGHFYMAEAAPHYFHNHFPSWMKRIKNNGIRHFMEMVVWLVHPSIYKYYVGMVLSLFHKRIRY